MKYLHVHYNKRIFYNISKYLELYNVIGVKIQVNVKVV